MKAFGNYHPGALLGYFLAVLLIAMFSTNPVLGLLALAGAWAFLAALQKPRQTLADMGFYLPLFCMIAVTNPLFSHNGVTPLFFLNGNPVTLEAIFYGLGIGVTLTGVLVWCRCFSQVMTEDKFLYLFGRLIPKLSLVLAMALRFIPLFKRHLKRVSQAQKAMGLYAGRSYFGRVQAAMGVFFAMAAWSLENAMETAASMRARGYGLKGRTNFSLFRFTPRDGALLAVCGGLTAVTALGAALGYTAFAYYPRLTPVDTSPLAVVTYVCFAALAFLPGILEAKEALVWKYYRSKI